MFFFLIVIGVRALLMLYVRMNFENKFGIKKGERDPHTPLQAFCGVKGIKKAGAGALGGVVQCPAFPPALTMGENSICLWLQCVPTWLTFGKRVSGSEHRMERSLHFL
jgi:hypothetical protein